MINLISSLPRVAASVTLYNSHPVCVDIIATYQNQVEHVYLIDNSEQPDIALIETLTQWPNVQYISNEGNLGVAASLNKAAKMAITDGFDFLLTMDDDTGLPQDAVHTMLTIATRSFDLCQIAIISGIHSLHNYNSHSIAVPYTMTSGNLLNLTVYKHAGPFREDFFIDHIDHEYGLRLNEIGYRVIELPQIRLQHQLGEQKTSKWGSYTFVSHSPVRGYYMVRNGLVLARIYPTFRYNAFILIAKELLKLILFEDQRLQRLRLFGLGIKDASSGRLGKFDR